MDIGEKINAINLNLARIFPSWPGPAEARREVLREAAAMIEENQFTVPLGQIMEVADRNKLFNCYHAGVRAEEIAQEIRTSNPGWWEGVPRLDLRPATIKDEPQFRIRITIGDEEEEFMVRNVQEAVSRFEFLLWETRAMPDYKNLTVEDEQNFRRTGFLRYGNRPDGPVLEVVR